MLSISHIGSNCYIPAVFDLKNDVSLVASIARILDCTQLHLNVFLPMKSLVSQREKAIHNLDPGQVKNTRGNNSTTASFK